MKNFSLTRVLAITTSGYSQLNNNYIERYCSMRETLLNKDVTKDEDFKRSFVTFFKLHRMKKEHKDCYFEILEQEKTKFCISYSTILNELFDITQRVETSFSSKLISIIEPNRPVWNSIVAKYFSIQRIGNNKIERIKSSVKMYAQLEAAVTPLLVTSEFLELKMHFDKVFPKTKYLTDTKILDFSLWGAGRRVG